EQCPVRRDALLCPACMPTSEDQYDCMPPAPIRDKTSSGSPGRVFFPPGRPTPSSMAQWTQEKSAELGEIARVRPGRRAAAGGLISRFTLRTVALALGVEFPYAVLVPIAYLQMAGIADPGQRRHIIAFLGLLHLLKTVFLAGWLVHLLRPI